MLKHAYIMRNDARRKLIFALNNGSMTEGQRSKIYDNNFDEFVTKPVLSQFELEGIFVMRDRLATRDFGRVPLPIPFNFDEPKSSTESESPDD